MQHFRKVFTLVLVRDCEKRSVLLGMKKRGFGAGRWNGFGGKVEPGETVVQAARRELQEECGVIADRLLPAGHIEFEFENEPRIMDVRIFTAEQFSGEPVETEEMRPAWFAEDAVPFDQMWPDDRLWFPLMFRRQLFTGEFLFRGHDLILKHRLQQVEDLSAVCG